MKTWTIICFVVFVLISGISIQKYSRAPKEIIVPIRTEIEQAIKVKSTDNVIEESKMFGLGVGVGAPQIVCKSAEQFASLVPEGERIFTSLKLENVEMLKKIYLSFIADRAGVIIYEERHKYSHSERLICYELRYQIKNYDWQEIVFRKNIGELVFVILVYTLLIFIAWIVGLFVLGYLSKPI